MKFERPMTFRQVRLKLQAAGFSGISQTRNHAMFIKQTAEGPITAILPHYTELSPSVVASIWRQSKLSSEEFERL